MTGRQEAFAQAAEALVGSPFRLHGRSREHGLDCVGLVAAALEASGHVLPPIPPYALRNSRYDFVPGFAERCGFCPVSGEFRRGDLVMVAPGPGQRHLLIAVTPIAFVHGHAGLRRVVRTPLRPDWNITHHWRLA
ncbi:C40 family peptidase [Parerythrobacter lacustris]|uniref:C40 family peptidase n=1 Tax=Parerythrobacter lacustris TaxID=2969984 RepID=A0ABT1XRJ1_9SPHN|nr:C40 family peptidase [Parerythrobacter lacustris]MCR2834266.1 C40 family peptidase [Parerythrobacter lacustris]